MSELMDEKRFKNSYFNFKYDKYIGTFRVDIDSFECYGYGYNADKEDENEKGLLILMGIMEKELNAFLKLFNELIKSKYKNLTAYYEDEEGRNLSQYIQFIKKIIQQHHKCPSNDITLYVKVNDFKSLIPSELEMDSVKNKKYLDIYEKFIKFLHDPAHMPSGIWGGHIADICRILNISSKKLNNIVASNFKGGQKIDIKPEHFEDLDSDYMLKELGDCFRIEHYDSYGIVYSAKKKHLYYLDYEHTEIEPFYESFPYNSSEFEDLVYYNEDNLDLKAVRYLFNNYNKEHNISFK